jgi:flagellar biogenesis protein FliO
MDGWLDLATPAPLSLTTLTVNLLLSVLLATVLAWFYTRYGRSMTNRARFAQVLPVLALTTAFVISVIKSSLALSLGLVGALSIVRFRAAIKEPEELVYLFMAIAIGLGVGADQRLPTILAIVVILGYLFVRVVTRSRPMKSNLYLNVLAETSENVFPQVNQLLLKHVGSADLRRLDRSASTLQATYLISCPNDEALTTLMDDLSSNLLGCEFSFVEQSDTLGG